MNLYLIPSTAHRSQIELNQLITQKTSCNSKDFDQGWCTKKIIASEIEELRLLLPENSKPPIIDYNKELKKYLQDVLVKYRKLYFDIDTDAKDRIINRIRSNQETQNATDEQVCASELSTPFYSLNDAVKQEERIYSND